MAPSKKRVKPAEHPVAASDLKRLFALSDETLRLAPWEYLHESQVFGVRLTGDEERTYWVNVIGGGGEVFAVNLYRGVEGMRGLSIMLGAMFASEDEAAEFDSIEVALEQCLFQVEFCPKADLDSWDRKALKKVRRSLPAKRTSLVARLVSGILGYIPWRLDAEEGPELVAALESALTVLNFLEDDPDFCPSFPSEEVLVFEFHGAEGFEVLREDVEALVQDSTASGQCSPLTLDEFSKEKHLALPQLDEEVWEVATSALPTPIDDRKTRPYFPYACLVCERQNGTVLNTEIYQQADLAEVVAKLLIQSMDALGGRPSVVCMDQQNLLGLVGEWLEQIGVSVEEGPCTVCDEAFDGMLNAIRE